MFYHSSVCLSDDIKFTNFKLTALYDELQFYLSKI